MTELLPDTLGATYRRICEISDTALMAARQAARLDQQAEFLKLDALQSGALPGDFRAVICLRPMRIELR